MVQPYNIHVLPYMHEFDYRNQCDWFCTGYSFFVNKTRYIKRGGTRVTQEELRNLYKERLEREKQTYISKMVKIDPSILSKFKTGKIDLYPNLFERLEDYLLNS